MEPWFDYDLPPELVAQEPLRNRADARLMIVDRAAAAIDHAHVRDLPEILRPRRPPGPERHAGDSRPAPRAADSKPAAGGRGCFSG